MSTFAFSGGFYPARSYGTRAKIRHVGTWAAGDDWNLEMVGALSGAFTIGKGNIADQTYSCALKLRDRMYLGFSSSFALSAIQDVTLWEEQNPGAAVITFLSQYGPQDDVRAFGVFEGKLVVFGRQSIQVWQTNADPAQFVLLQTLDNSGTRAPLSVKSIGDLDVYYLEDSGIRSIKAKELNANAYIADAGVAIDSLIKAAQLSYDSTLACGVVDPGTKQYWLFLNGTIYVLSNYPSSKVVAWSTFKPQYQSTVTAGGATYVPPGLVLYTVTPGEAYYWVKGTNSTGLTNGTTSLTASGGFIAAVGGSSATETGAIGAAVDGTLYQVSNDFTPRKFVVSEGQIFVRGSNRVIYRYGGSDNNSYDHALLTVELPWLDMQEASMKKQLMGIDAAFTGHWNFETSTDPTQTSYNSVIDRGSQTSPSMVSDSTFDKGRFPARGCGTHIKVKAISYTDAAAKLGKLNIVYNKANKK